MITPPLSPKDDPELLALMLSDEAGQRPVYRPSVYWSGYQQRTVTAIRRHGIGQFRSHPDICKGFAYTGIAWPEEQWSGWKGSVKRALAKLPPVNGMLREHQAIAKSLEDQRDRALAAWYGLALPDLNLPETTAAGGRDSLVSDRGPVSRQYLQSALRLANFSQAVRFDRVRSVLEIGGGFGFWPHLLTHRHPNVRKILYLDIPPMIYLATQYLKMFMPVRDYRETRSLSEIRFRDDDDLEVICLCPWQIEAVRSPVDVLWNIASFSEMSPDIVENYGRHIAPLSPKAVCVVLNKTGSDKGSSARDVVMQSLGGGFRRLEPRHELPSNSPYFVSLRDAALAATNPQQHDLAEA